MAKATTRAPKTPRGNVERVARAVTGGRITKHQGETATIAPSATTAAAAMQPSASFGGNHFGAPPLAPFQRATNGTDERTAWARSSYGGGAFGYGPNGPIFYNMLGGRTAREQAPAAAVANELATSNPVIAALCLNLSTQALGQGLTLTAKPDAKALGLTPEQGRELSKALESAFLEWACDPLECDWTGRFTLAQIANAHFLSAMLSGEALTCFEWEDFGEAKFKTKLKLLDVSQLDRSVTRYEKNNVNVIHGVGFTQSGRVAGYMLRDVPLGSLMTAPAAIYVPTRTSWGRVKVLHTIESYRDPRQVRGLSPLVSALTPAHERETLGEFALGKAFLENQFAISVESNLPAAQALDGLQINDVAGNTENWLAMREQVYGKAKITPQPGTINHLAPGDKLHFHKSETPNNTFESFDRSLVRKAAKAVGSSVEDVSGDFSQTSFSASRWAAGLPHEINLVRRKNICEHLYRAAYVAFVEEAIERELIELPPNAPAFYSHKAAYCGAKFLGKGMIQPDPKKAAEAQLMRMENGLASFAEIIGEEGKDLEAHVEALVAERDLLAKNGLQHPFYVGATTTQKRLSAEDVADEPQPANTKPEKDATKRKTQRKRSAKAHLVKLEPYEPAYLSADEVLAM